MGVPKFYRWISERYPCLSEVIKEYQIPDFDNLYLDMNGIIHTCSHPNDDDPHFRITEEKIFSGICYYIDFLFKMIKPKKVFFMAVDGVAPRAKMNQQRGRRFRTAKAAVILEERAKLIGENLPTEARFDSNCITPGTVFMARLHEKLKSFIVYKISTDMLWRGVRVYLSGHETPGEGEHKIMDFIRYEKSQSGYDPNTRHCLYGLDADLIMLGLCSHEPHFSLLREEVKFGGKRNQKRILTPEETTFHLLHISLLREYLDYEFQSVKTKIKFPYDIEHIIDDFVLMSFLVGNDFIPNLPQLHIQHDALPMLYRTYIDVLPSLGGYINESGHLHLERFEMFLSKLAEYDFQKFEEQNDDFEYLESKSKLRHNIDETNKIKTTDILSDLGFSKLTISKTAEFDSSTDEEDDVNDETDGEESTLELAFINHKNCYYLNKLDFDTITPEVMKEQAEGYVRAIQWNLHYYYDGVISWSWYYPHHYSPYISDLKDFKDMKMEFEYGKPFLPFQQLLAVLPKLSKELLPLSYQDLMCNEDSPLIDYYPDDFETDLNGKQQEWEAVVLIPFINEKLLLKFASEADEKLNSEERKRNRHGPHLLYTSSEELLPGLVASFLPGYFPDLKASRAKLQEISVEYFRLPVNKIIKGLCEGVILDKFFMGFPTLKTLKHTAKLSNEKVKVFQMVSQKDNMMLFIKEIQEKDLKKVAEEIVGKTIYVGWPHFRQASVIAVSDGKVKYSIESSDQQYFKIQETTMDKNAHDIWTMQTESVEEHFYQRWGIFVGEVEILVYVKCFTGSRYVLNKAGQIVEEKQWEKSISNYALQTTLKNVDVYYPENTEVKELFTPGLVVFDLGSKYGCMGTIIDNNLQKHNNNLFVKLEIPVEPDLKDIIRNQHKFLSQDFMPVYKVAQYLGIKGHYISRLTGTFLLQTSTKECISPNRVNIGLNLKFNKKNEEVCGFSKKTNDNVWLYSENTVKTINKYLEAFPEFFDRLQRFINEDIVYLEDIYPDGDGNQIINEISHWLKAQSCSSAERQKCGMEKLDEGVIMAIEQKVNETMRQNKLYMQVEIKPQNLYSPFLCKGASIPDPSTDFQLFDRVVNVWHSSSVPLGLRGTIIGVKTAENENDYMYEVVFDEEFFGGLSINCSSKKGYRMPPSGMINISYGKRKGYENESPKKRLKDTQPFKNTNLFSSAIESIRAVNPPANSQIQVLKKNPNLIEQPFYKAGVGIHSSPDQLKSNLFVANTGGSSKKFDTPTASPGRNYVSFSSPPTKATTNNVTRDYHHMWADMKKNSSPESSPSKNPTGYTRRIYVEELFASVDSQKQASQLQTLSQLPQHQASQESPVRPQHQAFQESHVRPQHQAFQESHVRPQHQASQESPVRPQHQASQESPVRPQHQASQESPVRPQHQASHDSPVTLLMTYCTTRYGTVPQFSYAKYGTIEWSIATVTLPNRKSFSSQPFTTEREAADNAAEKALAFLHSNEPRPFPPHVQQNFPNNLTMQRPLLRPGFSPDSPNRTFPQYPAPLFRQNLPVLNPFIGFDIPLARHPYPANFSHIAIPDSFVQHNRQLLQHDRPPFASGFQTDVAPSHQHVARPSDNSVVHLPGPLGGTASVRNANGAGVKGFENSSSKLVPTQVMKNSKVAEDTSAGLSNAEWPALTTGTSGNLQSPPKEGNNVVLKNTSMNESETISFSDKVKATFQKSPPVNPVPSEAKVVLKPKKKRLAANFSNI